MLRTLFLTLFAGWALVSANAARPGFTLWQLPPQGASQMNSYVIRTDAGQVVVIDGGTADDAPYLRGFLAALGNRVTWWFVTHPHADHMGALTEILRQPAGIEIGTVFQSPMTPAQLVTDLNRKKLADAYFEVLAESGIPVENLTEAGKEMRLDGLHLKILQVNDPEMLTNAYNNASIVLRLWDKRKSILMLADTGEESGDRLLRNVPQKELDCDYIQMAHHGQMGVRESFYRTVRFRACMWPTPLWVWNNDVGEGYNTAWMKTIDTRRWMDEKGISEHHCAWQGLIRIE